MGSFHKSELQYRIAGVYGHGRRRGSQVAVQQVVGGSRRQHVVVQGSAGGRTDAGVRGVGKQDLQWMLVQWQQDQHARRKVVEQGGHAWVSWQQELEKLCVLEARQQQIMGMEELAARRRKGAGCVE